MTANDSPPLPSVKPWNGTPDEVLRVEVVLTNIIQSEKIIESSTDFGEYFFHPGMCEYDNTTLIVSRGKQGTYHEIPLFHWLDEHNNPNTISKYGIVGNGQPSSFSSLLTVGSEDVRLLPLEDGTIHMSYTVPIASMKTNIMGGAELMLSKENNKFTLKSPPYYIVKVWMYTCLHSKFD